MKAVASLAKLFRQCAAMLRHKGRGQSGGGGGGGAYPGYFARGRYESSSPD